MLEAFRKILRPAILAGVCIVLAGPGIAADKSVTPDSKPGPAAPHSKPGSEAAKQEEEAARTPYAKVVEVFSGDTTVAGEKVSFPQTDPSVKSLIVSMDPGEKTAWHQHGAPMFAYILQGEITVTYEGLGKKVYREGDGLLEAMHVTHEGQNTGEGPARILTVFLLGDNGTPTVIEDAPGETRQKVE